MRVIKRIPVSTIVFAIACCKVSGFSPISSNINVQAPISTTIPSTSLYAGGFGGGGGMSKKVGDDKKKKPNKETKLKPKQQWDRYSDFKRELKIQVGVRIKDGKSDEWLEVGRVKSKDGQFTEAAVFRQRGIIAEVSIQVSSLKVF